MKRTQLNGFGFPPLAVLRKSHDLELPTITFANSYIVKDKLHDLHVEYHGHAHTAGDVVVSVLGTAPSLQVT